MNCLAAGQIGSVNVEFEGTFTMSFPRARRAVICATILGLAIISQSPLALAKGFPVNEVIAAIKSEINSARLARRKGGQVFGNTSKSEGSVFVSLGFLAVNLHSKNRAAHKSNAMDRLTVGVYHSSRDERAVVEGQVL